MERPRIDGIARWLSTAGGRRGLLGGLLTAPLAVLGLGPADDAEARRGRCPKTKKRCGRRCIRIDRNRNHCGRCRRRCRHGEVCQGGQCLPLDPTIRCRRVLRAAGCVVADEDDGSHVWECDGARLVGANLTNCRLVGANFSDCNLRRVRLTRADLSDANFNRCDLTHADLTSATMRGGRFGHDSDLTNADLSGIDLRFGSIEEGPNFTGANFSGADVSIVYWSVVTCPDGEDIGVNETCCGHFLPGQGPAEGCQQA